MFPCGSKQSHTEIDHYDHGSKELQTGKTGGVETINIQPGSVDYQPQQCRIMGNNSKPSYMCIAWFPPYGWFDEPLKQEVQEIMAQIS